MGGFACLLAAALGLFGLLFLWGATATMRPVSSLIFLAPAMAEIALYAIAGFRLRAGRGLIWGSVAALLLLVELLAKIAMLNVFGLVINGVLLVGVVAGLRGALALRRGKFDTGEAAAIFE